MFDLIIFVAVLYALTTETIEDTFVILVYQIMFGRRAVLYALVLAVITVASIMIVILVYGIPSLEKYSQYIIKASGLFLIGLGSYWIAKFLFVRKGILKEELNADSAKTTISKSLISFLMVFVELLEILAILVPFMLSNHFIETSLAAIVSLTISFGLIFVVGSKMRARLKNKLGQIKLFAGIALVLSGIVIVTSISSHT